MSGQEPGPGSRGTLWRRFVGEADRVGWWTLPAFLAVGLAGAVMAGALAVVYYSQQVADLEAQTREARQDLRAGVDAVDRAREDAIGAIEAQVDEVREALDDRVPVDDLAALGLVVVEARVNAPAPASATVAPSPGAASPAPTGSPRPVEPRLGTGFAVAVEDGQTYVATSHGLVRDENARAGVVEEVVVRTADGREVTGTVHSWDEDRGLALLRVPAGELPIADWRPRGELLGPGDAITLAGLTPDAEPVTVAGTVALADVEKVVAAVTAAEFLRGAPVLDRTGRVVAVYTPEYRPFGAAAGDRQAMAPVGLFCERMLSGCESLEAEAAEPAATPSG